jgi:hypothetical protein
VTAPDYPLMALGSYETYQHAHIATYIAERLARHDRSDRGRDGRAARAEAVHDIAGAATALANATGTSIPDAELPRPLDADTFAAARQLLATGPRTADVVALAGISKSGYAVVGHVPGLGAVGARVASKDLADALRAHFLTQPAGELAPWVVTRAPQRVPTLLQRVDLAAFVEHLDPGRDDDRAVARNLRGQTRRTDAAIRGRFAGVDLDPARNAGRPKATSSSPAPTLGGPRNKPSAPPTTRSQGCGAQRSDNQRGAVRHQGGVGRSHADDQRGDRHEHRHRHDAGDDGVVTYEDDSERRHELHIAPPERRADRRLHHQRDGTADYHADDGRDDDRVAARGDDPAQQREGQQRPGQYVR